MGRVAPGKRGRHAIARNHSFLRFRPRVLIFFVLFWAIVLVSVNVYLINSAAKTHRDNHQQQAPAGATEDKLSRIRRYKNKSDERRQERKKQAQPKLPIDNNHEGARDAAKFFEEVLSDASPDEPEEADQQKQEQQAHHLIFSTSCHYTHDWLSYLFFFQAMRLDQPGDVWRIVSGCTFEQEEEMQGLFDSLIQPMSDNFHLHFTPQFGRKDSKEWQSTKYWNKPFGVHHWLENVLGYPDDASKEHDNDVVILVDPDMLLMRPFVNDFSEFPLDLWTSHNRKKAQKEPLLTKVLPGKPMAQDYNYGEAFLEAAESNLTHVVGKDSPIHNLTRQDAKVLYSGGPPYVFTAKDMHQVTTYWTKFLPRLFDIFPKFMAEMYAYNLATAHLEMPQQLARGFMVSNVVLDQGEGWYFLKDVPPEQICHRSTKRFTPQVLHFCQRYSIGDYFISKYMYPDLIQCDTPLVRLPEKDAAVRYNFSHYGDGTTDTWPEKKEHLKNKNAFMVCMLLPAINDAARYYKTNHCSERANYNETWEYFAWKEEENQKKKPRRE